MITLPTFFWQIIGYYLLIWRHFIFSLILHSMHSKTLLHWDRSRWHWNLPFSNRYSSNKESYLNAHLCKWRHEAQKDNLIQPNMVISWTIKYARFQILPEKKRDSKAKQQTIKSSILWRNGKEKGFWNGM